jgi:response regulator RpfG family c-di-GMP phosphodiesterase
MWNASVVRLGERPGPRGSKPEDHTLAVRPQTPLSQAYGVPTVMVVDDEPMVLRMMAHALQQAGYTVHKASNGPDALALAEGLGKTLDLVVTDVQMEPIGGPELASLLSSARSDDASRGPACG